MRLISLLKNTFVFQDVASWLWTKIPPIVEHNLGKYTALRKAFYLTALERLDGDYLEFGVFTGSSFIAAVRAHKALAFLGDVKTAFYGFDSFSGFGAVTKNDKHPFYLDTVFAVNADRVITHIQKKTRGVSAKIIRGYFEETLANKTAPSLGILKARVILIDCDLKQPARLSLEFARPALQPGTIVIMDDFFSYRGDAARGVAGAYYEFCQAYPAIEWRKIFDYGYGGVAFMVSAINKEPIPAL